MRQVRQVVPLSLTNVTIQLCEPDKEKGGGQNIPTSQELQTKGSKSIYSAPLSQIGSCTNLQNSELQNDYMIFASTYMGP